MHGSNDRIILFAFNGFDMSGTLQPNKAFSIGPLNNESLGEAFHVVGTIQA